MKDNVKNTTDKLKDEQEKCFVIMPISDQGDYPKGHFTKVYDQIFKPAIEAAGYEAYRVDEDKISNPIINKIFDAVQNCPMALCDLSNRNPNVLYELGLRQAYDKPVVLVQDEKTQRIFDVSGINTVQYSSERLYENVMEARIKITEAIISTREGKENSIVKIVRAETASMNVGEISKEDRMEVMLNSIMSEVKEIRNITGGMGTSEFVPKIDNVRIRELQDMMSKADRDKILNLKWNGKEEYNQFRVHLKKDITPQKIEYVINKLKSMCGEVRHGRDGRELYVTVINYNDKMEITTILEILSELGEIY
ncbi:hypothetical protein [Dorea sp.]